MFRNCAFNWINSFFLWSFWYTDLLTNTEQLSGAKKAVNNSTVKGVHVPQHDQAHLQSLIDTHHLTRIDVNESDSHVIGQLGHSAFLKCTVANLGDQLVKFELQSFRFLSLLWISQYLHAYINVYLAISNMRMSTSSHII